MKLWFPCPPSFQEVMIYNHAVKEGMTIILLTQRVRDRVLLCPVFIHELKLLRGSTIYCKQGDLLVGKEQPHPNNPQLKINSNCSSSTESKRARDVDNTKLRLACRKRHKMMKLRERSLQNLPNEQNHHLTNGHSQTQRRQTQTTNISLSLSLKFNSSPMPATP